MDHETYMRTLYSQDTTTGQTSANNKLERNAAKLGTNSILFLLSNNF